MAQQVKTEDADKLTDILDGLMTALVERLAPSLKTYSSEQLAAFVRSYMQTHLDAELTELTALHRSFKVQ